MSKVLIAGAGSIGTVVGALLARQYHEIVLLRRKPPYGKLEIEIFGEEEFTQNLLVVDIYQLEFIPDVVIFSTQGQHTSSIVEDLKDLIDSSTTIVSMQNGLDAAKILCYSFPSNPIIQCSIWWSATLYSPISVLYHRKALSTIGIPDCSMATEDNLNSIYEMLGSVIKVEKTLNINSEMRKKLLLNTVSPILALVKQPYPEGLNIEEARILVHLLFDEALNLALQEGWDIDDSRLRNFHEILAGRAKVPQGPERGNTPHKVSTQIGLEKYGGRDSNIGVLLQPFIDLGGSVSKRVHDIILVLNPNYQIWTQDQLSNLIDQIGSVDCPWK